MKINVNGEEREVPREITISGLLEHLRIDQKYVAVELDLNIVPRAKFGEQSLKENDNLEIVTFVGGG